MLPEDRIIYTVQSEMSSGRTGEIKDNQKSGRVRSGKAGAKVRAAVLNDVARSKIAKKAASTRWKMSKNDQNLDYIDKNLQVFQQKMPGLLKDHLGRYVLLHNEEISGIYDTVRDAQVAGNKLYPDGKFSIQKIATKPVDLGYFSHAVHMGQA